MAIPQTRTSNRSPPAKPRNWHQRYSEAMMTRRVEAVLVHRFLCGRLAIVAGRTGWFKDGGY